MQFLTGRGYFLFVAEKPSPTGEGGPKGRMRGECASIARERDAAETLPSSVTCGDSFPLRGSLWSHLPQRRNALLDLGGLVLGGSQLGAGLLDELRRGFLDELRVVQLVREHAQLLLGLG